MQLFYSLLLKTMENIMRIGETGKEVEKRWYGEGRFRRIEYGKYLNIVDKKELKFK